MGQERLNDLLFIAVESEYTKKKELGWTGWCVWTTETSALSCLMRFAKSQLIELTSV